MFGEPDRAGIFEPCALEYQGRRTDESGDDRSGCQAALDVHDLVLSHTLTRCYCRLSLRERTAFRSAKGDNCVPKLNGHCTLFDPNRKGTTMHRRLLLVPALLALVSA